MLENEKENIESESGMETKDHSCVNCKPLKFIGIPNSTMVPYYKDYIEESKKRLHFTCIILILLLMVPAVYFFMYSFFFFPIWIFVGYTIWCIYDTKVTKEKSKRNEYEDILRCYDANNTINRFYDYNKNVTFKRENNCNNIRFSRCRYFMEVELSGSKSNGDIVKESVKIPFNKIIYNNKISVPELDVSTGECRFPKLLE